MASPPFVVRLRWLVLAAFVALSAFVVPHARDVTFDDDVLAFLPPDHPDVIEFRRIARRFGMLDVALVGIDGGADGVLTPAAVASVRRLAERIEQVEGVRLVLSFADLPHPVVTPGGLEVSALVPEGLEDPQEIRHRVLDSRDAVGNLVSADGRAAALLVFLAHAEGADRSRVRATAVEGIRAAVEEAWHGTAYLGGAPFVEHEAAVATRHDLSSLSPMVIAVLAVSSALLLHSVAAAALNLVLAGLAILWVLGLHALFGEPLSIVSNTLPVLMVALGGAFGVHMISGYRRRTGEPRERAAGALRELFVPVLLSGLTTAIAFFALVVLPQVPVRRFGVVAGLGMLLLLVFALVVLPALLSVLPRRALPHHDPEGRFARLRSPRWLLVVVGILAAGAWTTLRADPDTMNVFAPDSAPRRAASFFDTHFGGSAFVQIGIEGDLGDPAVLQAIRDLGADLSALEGIADVRSAVEPIATLNAALGGRRGIPETPGRAARVLTYLADHPAMAQLMTPEKDAALVHVKLAPLDGAAQQTVLTAVERIVDRVAGEGRLLVYDTTHPTVRAAHRRRILELVGRELGRALTDAEAEALARSPDPDARLVALLRDLRDRALDSDESPVEGVPRAEIETIDPASLYGKSEAELEEILRGHLPTLVATDPEGIRYVAEHLHAWIEDAVARWQVGARCEALGLPAYRGGNEGSTGEGADRMLSAECSRIAGLLAELDDATWAVGEPIEGVEPVRSVPLIAGVTGQPVMGRAFAESVTENLRTSTLVSAGALAVVLLVFGYLAALVPALWTLAVVGAVVALLGHTVSIGTSMVTSLSLGAGVDFAIHLLFRARQEGGDAAAAVRALGGVVVASGATVGLAFFVLARASMPPIAEFGVGIAVALSVAAVGAILWVPHLRPPPAGSRSDAHVR
ncbi:MAG: hypothetical protein D6705_02845 [Deltaproteobacteria bacterium]|nr:MAG: hypothetical protein D6705_02845 [Deltaproteobacteria bacterium]